MTSLLDTLSQALKDIPGSHRYTLQIARSHPRRAHALFPYSAVKVWQEEVLVLLTEEVPIVEGKELEKEPVPIVAIEAALYTVPSTSTSLVYISKVDSTGLALPGSPTRSLAAAFLKYHLEHPPHDTRHVRVHVFARAQGQYLFPGSVDNKGKRVLDDKGLLRWWKSTISHAATDDTSLHYLVPGLSELEAMSYVPSSSSAPARKWAYGHPYTTLRSPLHPDVEIDGAHWFEHIPSFPDDPKARFIHSLTSSVVEPAGQEGDYDDVMLQLLSSSFTTGSSTSAKLAQVDKDRDRERQRLVDGVRGGVEEFWERMAFRQECASGVLVGFFVVVRDLPLADPIPRPSLLGPSPSKSKHASSSPAVPSLSPSKTSTATKGGPDSSSTPTTTTTHPRPYEGALSHSIFTSLWSSFHNVDYAAHEPGSIARISERSRKWTHDLKRAIEKGAYVAREPEDQRRAQVYEELVWREVSVDNPLLTIKKGSVEGEGQDKKREMVVNKMVPRKKVKKV